MRSAPETEISKRDRSLKQPEVGNLIRELRQLMELTQEQLAAELGVTFGTVNRWENGHIQPSPLASRQIRAVLDRLACSSSEVLRAGSQQLLKKYFGL